MAVYQKVKGDASTIYIGIDVHKRSWHVTARTSEQEL